MSRGLGIEQRAIITALESDPARWWSRMALQQAAWGHQPGSRPDLLKRHPTGQRPYKNVVWWRGDKALTEGNFTRALRSLERRGLVLRHLSGRSYRLMSDEAVRDRDRMVAEREAWLEAVRQAAQRHQDEEHAAYLAMCERCGLDPETGVEWIEERG